MNAPLPTPEGMEPARTLAVRLWSDPPAVEDKIVAEIRARDAQWQHHLAAEREARAKAEAERDANLQELRIASEGASEAIARAEKAEAEVARLRAQPEEVNHG